MKFHIPIFELSCILQYAKLVYLNGACRLWFCFFTFWNTYYEYSTFVRSLNFIAVGYLR